MTVDIHVMLRLFSRVLEERGCVWTRLNFDQKITRTRPERGLVKGACQGAYIYI